MEHQLDSIKGKADFTTLTLIRFKLAAVGFFIFCSCGTGVPIPPMTIDEIKTLRSFDQVDAMQYIQLASSVEALDSIFEYRDTSILLFKELIINSFNKPVIIIDGDKNFKDWITQEQLDSFSMLKNSSQPSYPITNSFSAYAEPHLSKVGKEVRFLMHLYDGKKLMNSKGM